MWELTTAVLALAGLGAYAAGVDWVGVVFRFPFVVGEDGGGEGGEGGGDGE